VLCSRSSAKGRNDSNDDDDDDDDDDDTTTTTTTTTIDDDDDDDDDVQITNCCSIHWQNKNVYVYVQYACVYLDMYRKA